MKENFDLHILKNFSKGKYSYNDYLSVKEWFDNVKDFPGFKEELSVEWDEINRKESDEGKSLDHIFEKIHYKILLEDNKKERSFNFYKLYRQAAAVLLIPVFAFLLYYLVRPDNNNLLNSGWVEINAPEGARVEFFLPDSSSGWLNSGSKLKFPAVFEQNREVQLQGEAYFEVKHLANSDFTVDVPDFDVKVLGTKFNVLSYAADSQTEVVLAEGKVEISGKAGKFNHTMTPGKRAIFNRETRVLNVEEVDAEMFSAWKDGFLVIDNESLEQVLSRIERWYNAEIIVEDETLKSYRFKATFKDEPLEEVLRLIALTTPIKYSIDKREFDANGILKKKIVHMTLKNN
ncbi:DUF4974 domain-containing protein [Maribellus comscasis]|uniref:DUF4974 domain-containing protein n=1 Tax=Maribellus comscasis TaxID=2681766 RepID=A0A6I6JUD8_9BACT|nr:FecR domain-containing protein [Maribellus comscasis]QGY46666.1 DUF4974 domain-containing protein [Maribellus comscasis]